jgi:hypothetical protein
MVPVVGINAQKPRDAAKFLALSRSPRFRAATAYGKELMTRSMSRCSTDISAMAFNWI